MMSVKSEVEELLRKEFAPEELQIDGDECTGGVKLSVYIVSKTFDGMMLIDRHRAVQKACKELLSSGRLHALSQKCKTPEQHKALMAKGGYA